MRCVTCSAPLVHDPTNGETFCSDDPGHDQEDDDDDHQ